jgi:hypothetical protein
VISRDRRHTGGFHCAGADGLHVTDALHEFVEVFLFHNGLGLDYGLTSDRRNFDCFVVMSDRSFLA